MRFSWGNSQSVGMYLNSDKTTGSKVRIASLGDLTGFLRVSNNLLVQKCTKDLWSVSKTAEGGFEVSRLFDDDGTPLKF